MRHRVAGRHLGRDTAHRLSLYRNLVTDLFRYERITTTEAKAKEIRPMAEKMVTFARRGDLAARREVLRFVYDEKVVKHLFDDIGPRMRERPGGYLRITRLEPRKGDGARMATIEFVDFGGVATAMPRPQRVTASATAARSALSGATAASAAAPVADEAADDEGVQPGGLPENVLDAAEAAIEDGTDVADDLASAEAAMEQDIAADTEAAVERAVGEAQAEAESVQDIEDAAAELPEEGPFAQVESADPGPVTEEQAEASTLEAEEADAEDQGDSRS